MRDWDACECSYGMLQGEGDYECELCMHLAWREHEWLVRLAEQARRLLQASDAAERRDIESALSKDLPEIEQYISACNGDEEAITAVTNEFRLAKERDEEQQTR